MKKGRGKDHKWRFVKYKGNSAICAQCHCGFTYSCCREVREGNNGFKIEPAPEKLYPFCPMCGSKKKTYNDKVKSIDKFIFEL